jgi:hypothetical protein
MGIPGWDFAKKENKIIMSQPEKSRRILDLLIVAVFLYIGASAGKLFN